MGDTRSFGQMIRRRRNALGLSQARLGELVGRSASTIRKWERGETTPASRKDAVALAAVLGLDESEVLAEAGFEVEDSSPRETIEEAYASLRREEAPPEAEEPPSETMPKEPEPPPESTPPPRVVPRAAPPVVLERTGGGEPSYLEDPLERAWYRRRAVATAAVVIFLLIVFLWAWEAATAALADLWEDVLSMLQI